MTGFTVTDGFSVIPPRRPTTVTIAAWLMVALAVVALIPAALIAAQQIERMSSVAMLSIDGDFHTAVLLVVAAIVTVVLSQQLRRGTPAAQAGTFVVLGTAAVGFGSMAVGEFVALPFYGDAGAPPIVVSVLLSLATAAVVVPVVLLARGRANEWFRDRRRELAFDAAPATSAPRPPMLVTGIGFLILTGLLHIAGIAVYAGQLANLGVDLSTAYANLLGHFVTIGLPVLLLLTATIGLTVAARAFLVSAYGLCGYFCLMGLASLVQQALLRAVVSGVDWSMLLNVTLTVLAAAAAAVALFALGHRSVVSWFDERRGPGTADATADASEQVDG